MPATFWKAIHLFYWKLISNPPEAGRSVSSCARQHKSPRVGPGRRGIEIASIKLFSLGQVMVIDRLVYELYGLTPEKIKNCGGQRMKNMGDEKKNKRLHERIGLLMVRRQYRRALELLDKVIEEPLPLFQGEAWVTEERRLAWLYRIDLLRERERVTEALAWACLEVEMNPDNVAAVALKERLKRESGLLPKRPTNPAVKSQETSNRQVPWTGVAGMRDLKAMLERDPAIPATVTITMTEP